jgi:16S rRNA (uracil1498-N3)-methyltransferase
MKKSKTRIFVSLTISANLIIYIKNKQHHFLKNVLRAKINDRINIFDGKTGEWEACIASINRDNIVLRVIKNIYLLQKSSDVWLVFSPIKQHRMNLSIQKATELGVSKIIPCITEFTDNRNINIKSLQDNAVEAAEQSERLDLPQIENLIDLPSLLSSWPQDRVLIFCDEKFDTEKKIIDLLIPLRSKLRKFGVLIGPEGGFSELERKTITEHKKVFPVSLGKRILRSDTAIAVALFCIQDLFSS